MSILSLKWIIFENMLLRGEKVKVILSSFEIKNADFALFHKSEGTNSDDGCR